MAVRVIVLALGAMIFSAALGAQDSPKLSILQQWCVSEFAGLHEDKIERIARRHLFREAPVTSSRETVATRHFGISQVRERFEFHEIQQPRELELGKEVLGLGFYKAIEGTLRGQKIFAKVSYLKPGDVKAGLRKSEHLDNEVAWVMRLSQLEIGPRFVGVTTFEGHQTVVTEFVPGIHYSGRVSEIPQSFVPSRQLLESLKGIMEVIEREGIRTEDLQLRLTPDRAYVVDPEFFEPAQKRGDILKSQEEIQNLIDHLQLRLK